MKVPFQFGPYGDIERDRVISVLIIFSRDVSIAKAGML
jgi:hypothetical protein